MTLLPIGSFSKIAKVTTKALRYYDEIGLLRPAHVDADTGYRYYDVAQLEQVLLISRLKGYDLPLSEIAQVMASPRDNAWLLTVLSQKEGELRQKMEEYRHALDRLQRDIHHLKKGEYIMSYLNSIQVSLTETPPMAILSVREVINMQEYGRLLGKLFENVHARQVTPSGPPMSIYHGEEFDPENYDTEVAVPIKEEERCTRRLPAQLCAHATLKGPYSELAGMYAKIHEWIEKESYTLAGAPFEIYLTDPAALPPEEYLTGVYFPVEK